MLREVQELQKEAVKGILKALKKQNEVAFKAPTGSGKTHMMADLMNQVLSEDSKALFLVSTLSKGGLAEQNFEKFKEYQKEFPRLNPYLISSEDFGEESRPSIPPGYNVYVLGRDSYKLKGSKLTQVFPAFLQKEEREGKKIFLVKDECHQATNNLDKLSSFFFKTINFSATPKGKKQVPDVVLSEEEAVNCGLIREVEWRGEEETLQEAFEKFEKVKKSYQEKLPDLCPALIIQISNKGKAEEETEKIREIQAAHPDLLWASLMTKQEKGSTEVFGETNSAILKAKKKESWAAELKKPGCPVDVIIFKMVITEGWDIPRACMLYQIRDTDSKVLDEQVLGRIRRNPKLLDFEDLDEEGRELVTKAWAWGLEPARERPKRKVKLASKEVQKALRLKVTNLPTSKHMPSDFNLKELVKKEPDFEKQSIFSLYSSSKKAPEIVEELERDFVKDFKDWFEFCYHLPSIIKKTREAVDNLSNLSVEEEEVSFPKESYYMEVPGQGKDRIEDWIWKREEAEGPKDSRSLFPLNPSEQTFSFDSQAEKEWFDKLYDLAEDGEVKEASSASPLFDRGRIYLLGKNFLPNSKISYAYTMEGEAVLRSYPDFVMEGKDGTLYLFEVKSLEEAASQNILDPEAYKKKVEALNRWYKAASQRLEGYVFALPVRSGGAWKVYAYKGGESLGGEKKGLSWREFREFVKEQNKKEL